MLCAYCGLRGLGKEHVKDFENTDDYGICENCHTFILILDKIYKSINISIDRADVIDFTSAPETRILVDIGFISQNNTHTAAYTKTVAMLLEYSLNNKNLLKEIEVRRKISSLKSFGEIFSPFIYLQLIEVKFDKEQSYDRKIRITEKLQKFTRTLRLDSDPSESKLNKQIQKRTSLCLLGYVLLGLMKMHSETRTFPTTFRLRSLWCTFSYIWSRTWDNEELLDEKDFEIFIKRRGITNSTVGKILQSFRQTSPNHLNTLFEAIDTANGIRRYIYSKELIRTISHIRERTREEKREKIRFNL